MRQLSGQVIAALEEWLTGGGRQRGGALARLALLVVLAYYLPGSLVTGAGVAPVRESGRRPGEERTAVTEAAAVTAAAEEAIGVGGGYLEDYAAIEASLTLEDDLELLGIPEPAAYSRPRTLAFSAYTVQSGDMIGILAMDAGLNEDTLLSVNAIANSRLIQPRQILRIPNQDGIYYKVQKDDTLSGIAEKYEVDMAAIVTVNELFSDVLKVNSTLFIPGARMDMISRQEINGDLFIWPVSGYISSLYGYRQDPFGSGARTFHTGLDIAAPMGTPVRAAMAGRVTAVVTGDPTFGNYVVITHHSNYRTLYGHMSVIRVKLNEYVNLNQRIGDVGSTGKSTGPHLHFTVYKNGVTVNPRVLMR